MSVLQNIDWTSAIESKIDRSKWVKWKFSDLVENIVEKVVPKDSGLEHYIGLEHLDSGSLKIRRFGETESLIGDKLKIYKGDLIFAKRNAYLKRVAIADFDAVASAHSLVLRAKPKNVLPEFLPFFMLSEKFWERAIEISVGSLSPTINWKVLAKQEFLLPPKEEQAKLAELLWAMDEVIERSNNLKSNLEILSLVEENRIFNVELNSKLKKVVLRTLSGGTPDTKKEEYYSNGDIPWITTKILDGDYIGVGEKLITKKAIFESAAKILEKGNIVAGTRVGVGKFAINEVDISFSQDITGLEINNDLIDKRYLVNQLNSSAFQERIKPFLRGTTIKGITKDDLLDTKIFIPSLGEQKRIKTRIQSIKNSIYNAGLKIEASQSLQKSLINQIF